MDRKVPLRAGSVLLGAALAIPAFVTSTSFAASTSTAVISESASTLRTLPFQAGASKVSAALTAVTGPVDIVVQLTGLPLALANGQDAKHLGGQFSHAQQVAFTQDVQSHQDSLMRRILAMGGKEMGRVRVVYNAVIVRVDASKLQTIASDPEVAAIRPVGQYQVRDSDTNPYIGATAVQHEGIDGTGVRVAVLDSGIDYTHKDLGGPGTAAAYQAAAGSAPDYANAASLNKYFPTSKVVGGYDFVGDTWKGDGTPNDVLTPDPNPIDIQGHGTHVSDILGGRSKDGTHVGVAPGVELYAYKVCSSVTVECNGVALLEGLERALDPNGNGSIDDAVDIVSLSLGKPYGQIQDDLSYASANAVHAGVVVVAASGNDGDKPYVTGSPGSTPEVISVAETVMPNAQAIPLVINTPASIAGSYGNTATIDSAPITTPISGSVVFVGRGCTLSLGDTYAANPVGKIALVTRGDCNVSEKVRALSDAGAIGIIVGLTAAGDAVTFSNGGQCPTPADGTCKGALAVTLALSQAIQSASGVTATISNSNAIPLIGSVSSTSSRGPDVSFNRIKPDIAAPGASVSAVAGSGTAEAAFSGTSGAAPMISGSVALLLQAYPNRSPREIKSMLMNTADTQIYTNPAILPGVLAPITRIGGGEVRVDEAIASQTAAWDDDRNTGSLSFGYHAVDNLDLQCRPVRVKNYSRSPRVYRVKNEFRYADDAASKAVSFLLPPFVGVGPRSSAVFPACITIDAHRLPVWILNGGADGGTGSLLQTAEYDGYVTISDSGDNIHLAWQVLPHRSASVHAAQSSVAVPAKKNSTTVRLQNSSPSLDGGVDTFAWTGSSPRIPKSKLPGPGDDDTVTDLAAVGTRLALGINNEVVLQFGISTYGKRAHPAQPARFQVDIDADLDGKPDWTIFTSDVFVASAGTGQTAVFWRRYTDSDSQAAAQYYVGAALDSGNVILTVPLAALGLSPTQTFKYSVSVYDNSFTGHLGDQIRNMVVAPGVPKFFASGLPATGVPARGSAALTIQRIDGGDQASPSQKGILLLYHDAQTDQEADTIAVH